MYSGDKGIENKIKSMKIILEITNECNMKCDYCNNPTRKANKMLSDFEFNFFKKNILNNFKDYEYLDLCFTGGECTLHPRLEYFTKDLFDSVSNMCRIMYLTNGCSKKIKNIILSINDEYLKKIELITSFHRSQISLEKFCKMLDTYYDTNIKNSIRILWYDEEIPIIIKELEFLKIRYPKWNTYVKFTKGNGRYLTNETERELMYKYLFNFIRHGNELLSPEMVINTKKNNFKNMVCTGRLNVKLDGSFCDRYCEIANRGKNIFSEEVNLLEKTRPMICTLNECKSDCDILPGKYDIITYNKLIRK